MSNLVVGEVAEQVQLTCSSGGQLAGQHQREMALVRPSAQQPRGPGQLQSRPSERGL